LTNELLLDVTVRVLEDSAFVVTEPCMPAPSLGADVLLARIRFSGPEDGELRMRIPKAFALRLATNMLGVEPDDLEAGLGASDAAGETLNVIAGALMARVYGTRAACHLGVPRVVPEQPLPPQEVAATVSLVTDDALGLTLSVHPRGRAP
jgi:hypothetical protein